MLDDHVVGMFVVLVLLVLLVTLFTPLFVALLPHLMWRWAIFSP